MSTGSEIIIHLKNLRFFAHLGLYNTEKQNGNEFELDVSIAFQHPAGKILRIHDTINYATVHDLIKTEMRNPRELLETFLDELAQVFKESYPQITKIDLTIYKLTAPIPGLDGKVGVQLKKCYI